MKSRLIFVGVVALGAIALVVWNVRRTQPAAAPAFSPAAIAPPSPVSSPVVAVISPPSVPTPENPAEIAATARMYAAHASLRAPEVADPDFTTNRQILGIMVAKALAEPASKSPVVPDARATR
jgi:hypothetical protein